MCSPRRLTTSAALCSAALTTALASPAVARVDRPAPRCATIGIVAHRGMHPAGVDENTLAAFGRAAAAGHAIETDVWPDAEGRLWLVHDRNLARTTGHDVEIDSLSSAAVSRLRYRGAGSPIQAFDDLVAWLATHRQARAFIEPKKRLLSVPGTGAVNVPERIAAALTRAGVAHRSWITHYNEPTQAPQLRTRYRAVHLLHKDRDATRRPRELRAQGYDAVALRAGELTTDLVGRYHRVGISVQSRNSNRVGAWRRSIRSGADELLTDSARTVARWCVRHPGPRH